MKKTNKGAASIALSLGLCGLMLGMSTTPVYASVTSSSSSSMGGLMAASWTWKAAGREAGTWATGGAVVGAFSCGWAGAGVGAGAGTVAGFATYGFGQAYDWAFGRLLEMRAHSAPPATALD